MDNFHDPSSNFHPYECDGPGKCVHCDHQKTDTHDPETCPLCDLTGDVNEHAKIIADHVFHSFPYKEFKPNFKGPHAEDCEGCIVNAEVEKLIAKINILSPIKEILADLEKEKEKRRTLVEDRWNAFDKAGIAKEGSVADLVATLVNERDRLIHLIEVIDNDLRLIRNKIKE